MTTATMNRPLAAAPMFRTNAPSRRMDWNLFLLAAAFSLLGCVSTLVSLALRLGAVVISKGAQYLTVFSVEQLQTAAFTLFRLRAQAGHISLAFFAMHCVIVVFLLSRLIVNRR